MRSSPVAAAVANQISSPTATRRARCRAGPRALDGFSGQVASPRACRRPASARRTRSGRRAGEKRRSRRSSPRSRRAPCRSGTRGGSFDSSRRTIASSLPSGDQSAHSTTSRISRGAPPPSGAGRACRCPSFAERTLSRSERASSPVEETPKRAAFRAERRRLGAARAQRVDLDAACLPRTRRRRPSCRPARSARCRCCRAGT